MTGVRWWAVYTRCPRCGLLSPNSMRAPFFDRILEEPDWPDVGTLYLRCGSCGHRYDVTAGDRHAADTTSTCPAGDAVTTHPAMADVARCLSCGLLYRIGAIPVAVRARNGLARVEFDGWTVTLTRLWCPVPRWRHRRIPLDRVVSAEYAKPLSDAGSAADIRFVVRDRAGGDCRGGAGGGHRDRALWLWAFREWHPLRELRFEAIAVAINEAVYGRIRLLVDEAVGLGPWSDHEWDDIERRVPEVREVYRWPMSRTHREVIDRELRAYRGETGPKLPGWPRPVHGLPDIEREPYRVGRASETIWHVLADRVSDASDVRSSPRWEGVRRTVLGYARHWSTVRPARLGAGHGRTGAGRR